MIDVELNTDNLYSNGYIIELDSNESLLQRDIIPFEPTLQDQYHTVTAYDRIETIAWKYYKNDIENAAKYWKVIADANHLFNPLDLSPLVGKQILIPNILNALLDL